MPPRIANRNCCTYHFPYRKGEWLALCCEPSVLWHFHLLFQIWTDVGSTTNSSPILNSQDQPAKCPSYRSPHSRFLVLQRATLHKSSSWTKRHLFCSGVLPASLPKAIVLEDNKLKCSATTGDWLKSHGSKTIESMVLDLKKTATLILNTWLPGCWTATSQLNSFHASVKLTESILAFTVPHKTYYTLSTFCIKLTCCSPAPNQMVWHMKKSSPH